MFTPTNPYYQQSTQLVRVNGLDGARAYQMPPNSCAALFDASQDKMYIRTTDGAGFPSIRIFSFTEIVPQTQEKEASAVTREEFDRICSEVESIKEMLNNGKQPIRK